MTSKDIEKELNEKKELVSAFNSEGGKKIIDSLLQTVGNKIDKVANNFETLSHAELLGVCASLKSSIDILRLFKRSKENVSLLKDELEKLLIEEKEQTDL